MGAHIIAVSLLLFSTALALPTSTASPGLDQSAWDVIVVGSGPAGIIAASRMSEAGKRTLLLEQGGPSYYITGGRERPSWLDNTDLSRVDVPGLYKSIYTNPGHSLLCNSTYLDAYGACTVGGATAINAGLFFQPPASDFDLYFPQHWKSADMANATSKLRAKQPFTQDPSANGQYFVQSGYDIAREWLVDGAGYKDVVFNDAPNEKTKVFGRPEFMYVNGQRSGPVVTYLQDALKRSNFRFQMGARVKRIVRSGSRATGVIAHINGQDVMLPITSNGKIISSGGALFSPGLLMLSGIGDPAQLQTLHQSGILNLPSSTWVNNTAVGQGLFDNPNTFIELTGQSIHSYVYSYSDPIPADRDLYLQHRSGPYAFASETSAFWDTFTHPDGSITGLQGTVDSSGYGQYTKSNTITLNVYGTSGIKSTGRVTVDPQTGAPGATSFFYTQPGDSLAIATFVRRIFDGLIASKINLSPANIPLHASVAEIQKYIITPSQYTLGHVNHWSSSCRLGSCVDTNTKVIGTDNIYVVDGSIVAPLTTNPSFGIMMAAERASELILASGH